MSIAVMSYVWSLRGLAPTERLVLLKLADCAHDNGHNAFPSQALIAECCEITARSVRACLRSLEEQQFIEQTSAPTPTKPATYRVLLDREQGRKNLPLAKVDSGNPTQGGRKSSPDFCRKSDVDHKNEPSVEPSEEPSVGGLFAGAPEEPAPSEPFGPAEVIALWNATVSPPVASVRDLTPDRKRRIDRLLKQHPAREDWHAVIAYLNRQDWCRGSGRGEFPNWVMSLDWLIKKDSTLPRHLAQSRMRRPLDTRAAVQQQTRTANVRSVTQEAIFIPGMEDSK